VFQSSHAPAIDDSVSVVARVFRTGVPELLSPEELALVIDELPSPGTRAALRALGPRTTLVARIADEGNHPLNAKGVLVTAMSGSGRRVDEDDLQTLAAISQGLAMRLRF
jgi:hypothetical protein